MSKRGQFYVLGSIIIAIIVYGLATTVNVIQEEPLTINFNDLSNNYIKEAFQTINHRFSQNPMPGEVATDIEDYTIKFISYARSKNPNFGIVYVYGEGDISGRTIISNNLPAGVVEYDASGVTGILFNSEDTALTAISLTIGNEEFKHNVPVKLNSFSDAYHEDTIDSVESLKIDIGGTPFIVDDITSTPDFTVFISSSDEKLGTADPVIECSSTDGGPIVCP